MPDETRRDILKAIAIGAALAAVGGVAAYYAGKKKKTITETLTKMITKTETTTKTVTKTETVTAGATTTTTTTTTAATPAKPKLKVVPIGPCRFCGVGCGVQAQIVEDPETGMAKDIVALMGIPDYPVDFGALCTLSLIHI